MCLIISFGAFSTIYDSNDVFIVLSFDCNVYEPFSNFSLHNHYFGFYFLKLTKLFLGNFIQNRSGWVCGDFFFKKIFLKLIYVG